MRNGFQNSMKVFTNQRIVDNILKYVKGDMNNRLKSRVSNFYKF